MDGRVGRLRSESADSESGRPLATRLWGGTPTPPTRLVSKFHYPDLARLGATQPDSDPTQGRDRLGPTQPPDPTLPSLIWRPCAPGWHLGAGSVAPQRDPPLRARHRDVVELVRRAPRRLAAFLLGGAALGDGYCPDGGGGGRGGGSSAGARRRGQRRRRIKRGVARTEGYGERDTPPSPPPRRGAVPRWRDRAEKTRGRGGGVQRGTDVPTGGVQHLCDPLESSARGVAGHTHNYRHIERGNHAESAAGYASLFPASVRCSSTDVVFLLARGMASASGTHPQHVVLEPVF
ncbi:hypothetical protein Taro_038939 [Colocasia esculenta]|uniref:Uncharacterized protein n=1 Tax=Colocasia esculenta TaxID=4460 RepID=A0A843WQ36_COLES|nr:hypothetical protein [Colocasia esculenta]